MIIIVTRKKGMGGGREGDKHPTTGHKTACEIGIQEHRVLKLPEFLTTSKLP